MASVITLVELEAVMFLLMFVGGLLRKKNILTEAGQKSLSDLLLYVILPCNIFKSFLVEINGNVWGDFTKVLIICGVVLLTAVFGGRLFFRKVISEKRQLMKYGLVNGNVAFLGLPVSEGLYGSEGVLNATIYMIPHRILVWSYGMVLLDENTKKEKGIKCVLSLLLQPCMIAAEIGLLFMVFQFQLPSVLQMSVENLGKCLFPMSMLIIGGILSKTSIKSIVNRESVFFCLVRLVLLPAVAFVVGIFLHTKGAALGVSVVMAGMPGASITAILAGQFGLDQEFASEMVALSTVLSAVSIPVWSFLAQLM